MHEAKTAKISNFWTLTLEPHSGVRLVYMFVSNQETFAIKSWAQRSGAFNCGPNLIWHGCKAFLYSGPQIIG